MGRARCEMDILSFYHLRGGLEQIDVAPPKGIPRQLPLLNAKDEKLDRPKQCPGSVGDIAAWGVEW